MTHAHTIARGIAYEETGEADWSQLETSYGGGGYQIDREALAARITAAINADREQIAAWIDCTDDCNYANAGGTCQRINDFCSHYVADCIRRGCKP